MVSDPLTVRDCCLVTDGGGAAHPHPRRSCSLACETAGLHPRDGRDLDASADFGDAGSHRDRGKALGRARLRHGEASQPSDIDVAELYDAFTINTILFLEDLGFCPKGEGGRFVSDGAIAPGGRLPVNTNGGGLSYCHPGMYGIFLLIEAARQISRRMRGAADRGMRGRARPWQWRGAVEPGDRDSRLASDPVRSAAVFEGVAEPRGGCRRRWPVRVGDEFEASASQYSGRIAETHPRRHHHELASRKRSDPRRQARL